MPTMPFPRQASVQASSVGSVVGFSVGLVSLVSCGFWADSSSGLTAPTLCQFDPRESEGTGWPVATQAEVSPRLAAGRTHHSHVIGRRCRQVAALCRPASSLAGLQGGWGEAWPVLCPRAKRYRSGSRPSWGPFLVPHPEPHLVPTSRVAWTNRDPAAPWARPPPGPAEPPAVSPLLLGRREAVSSTAGWPALSSWGLPRWSLVSFPGHLSWPPPPASLLSSPLSRLMASWCLQEVLPDCSSHPVLWEGLALRVQQEGQRSAASVPGGPEMSQALLRLWPLWVSVLVLTCLASDPPPACLSVSLHSHGLFHLLFVSVCSSVSPSLFVSNPLGHAFNRHADTVPSSPAL